ncbi:McrB family protein [Streptomyces sp. NPDC004980]
MDDRADALDANADQRAKAQAEMLHGDRVHLITFHPSYGYEDFVEGFKPDLSATGPGLTLALTDGLFHTLCSQAAARPKEEFLLVIDEINRGDLPRIFGELITLLELDKRNLPVALPVSKRRFSVPPNVRVIGTMNTADRSISHLDAAVRRRFAFLPVGPDPDAVSGTVGPWTWPRSSRPSTRASPATSTPTTRSGTPTCCATVCRSPPRRISPRPSTTR